MGTLEVILLALALAGALLVRRIVRRSAIPATRRRRLLIAGLLLVCAVVIVLLITGMASEGVGLGRLWTGLAALAMVAASVGWEWRRLGPATRQEAAVRPQGSSSPRSFLGQAVLILVPVIALAALGLAFLREDRVLAEAEARSTASLLVTQWAAQVKRHLEQAGSEYASVRSALEADWRLSLGYGDWAPGTDVEAERRRIATWQARHPQIPLAEQPASRVTWPLRDGPEAALASGPPGQPAAWVHHLTAGQHALWHGAQLALATGQADKARPALQALLEIVADEDLRANARYLLTVLEADELAPESAATLLLDLSRRFDRRVSETGLSLGQLAWLNGTRRLPAGSGLAAADLAHVVHLGSLWPDSPLAELMLAELDRLARPDSEEEAAQRTRLRQLWRLQQRTAQIARELAAAGASAPSPGTVRWCSSEGEEFLTVIYPEPSAEAEAASEPAGRMAALVFP